MRRLWFLLPLAVALLLLLFVLSGVEEPAETVGPPDSAAEPGVLPAPEPSRPREPRRTRRRAPPPPPGPAAPREVPKATPSTPVDPPSVFEIRVLGPGDVPVPGVRFAVLRPQYRGALQTGWRPPAASAITDASGSARLPAAPRLEALVVRSKCLGQEKLTLTERVTVIRQDGFLPLDVTVVDAEDGRALDAEVHLVGDGAPVPRFMPTPGIDVALDNPHLGAYRLPLAPVQAGQQLNLAFRVDPPPGYVAPPKHVVERKGVVVSRYAERLRMTIPVRREAKVRVLVVDADLEPAVGAPVQVKIGVHTVGRLDQQTGRGGAVAVRGVPYLRGALVTATASQAGRAGTSPPVRLSSPGYETVLRVLLPEVPQTVIGIGGGVGGRMGRSGRIGRRNLRTGPGRIDVLVRGRDGRPVPGARIHLSGRATERTNEGGMVSFVNLPGGAFTLELAEPGLVNTRKEVRLDRGESLSVELVESEGRSIVVRVQNARGTGLPYAMLTLHGGYDGRDLWLADGVQHLDTFTDLDGNCIVPRVGGDSVLVTGRYGVLHASVQANVRGPVLLQLGP